MKLSINHQVIMQEKTKPNLLNDKIIAFKVIEVIDPNEIIVYFSSGLLIKL